MAGKGRQAGQGQREKRGNWRVSRAREIVAIRGFEISQILGADEKGRGAKKLWRIL